MTTSVHHVHGPTVITGCADLVIDDAMPVALVVAGPVYAARIAELLDRHGLADIPADAATLTEDH